MEKEFDQLNRFTLVAANALVFQKIERIYSALPQTRATIRGFLNYKVRLDVALAMRDYSKKQTLLAYFEFFSYIANIAMLKVQPDSFPTEYQDIFNTIVSLMGASSADLKPIAMGKIPSIAA